MRPDLKPCLAAAIAAAFAAMPALADDAAPDTPSDAEVDAALSRGSLLAMHADWADGFRRAAIAGGPALDAFFASSAMVEWKGKTREELDDIQLADFFTGAQVLVGAFDDEGAALAFWNPFWDTLLFVRSGDGRLSIPGGRFAESETPKANRFAWVSGESFRGEPPDSGFPQTSTTVPGADEPLAVSLWRVQKGTVARFNALYPPEAAERIRFRTGVDDPGSETEWTRIRARSALRLRMAPMLAANRVDFAVASRCAGLLRTGVLWQLRDHFRDAAHDFFCTTLAELPPTLRSEFEMYGYVPTPAATLFYYVETGMPRLFATVTVPAGRLKSASAGEVSMEWYDLDKAEELLAAWEEERTKGGAR